MSEPDSTARPVVVVADDDAAVREYLAGFLREHGMDVTLVSNGQEAIVRVKEGGVDLVLLDVVMPSMGGLETCRLLKADAGDAFLPVILLTIRNDTESRIEGLRIGADDYVGKPFDERELLVRVTGLLRIKSLHDQLTGAKQRLEKLAVHDELTGLYNYRYLTTRLRDEFKRAQRYQQPLACGMVDIDHFKRVNDEHGHDTGDEVLREVASRMRASVREVDVVSRYGGEEFLLILPHTNLGAAVVGLERLRERIAKQPFVVGDLELHVTISAGVAAYAGTGEGTKDMLIKSADRALYRAKADGRNRVAATKD